MEIEDFDIVSKKDENEEENSNEDSDESLY